MTRDHEIGPDNRKDSPFAQPVHNRFHVGKVPAGGKFGPSGRRGVGSLPIIQKWREVWEWGRENDPEAAAVPALLAAFVVLMLVVIDVAEALQ